jgi:phenylacetate-CoA ligase
MPARYRKACRTWRMYLKDRLVHPHVGRYWPQCVAVESMSRDELEQLQQQRLKALLAHVLEHVPYYRAWAAREGVGAGDEVALSQLPIVSKREYLAQPDAFVSDACDASSLRTHRTSGSSGEPLAVRNDAATRDYSYCCLRRALLRHGVQPGDRLVHVWGSGTPRFASRLKRVMYRAAMRGRDWMGSTLAISAYDLSDATLNATVQRIERFYPHYLHGYVSALHAMAMYLDAQQKTLRAPRLKLVVNDSEPFSEQQREIMQRVFGCRIVEHYGCLEVGNIAQEDPAGLLRINEDYLIVERSSEGEAIVTHLLASAMPFVRYRVGDVIAFDEAIGAGLPYRSLASIEGRTADLLPVSRGGYVHGLAIATAVYANRPEIQRYQVRQQKVDHFEIAVVCDPPLDAQAEQSIIEAVRRLTGEATQVKVNTVAEIPRELSGKFKLVVSDVRDHAREASAGSDPAMSDL